MNCDICNNFLKGIGRCKFCHFEGGESSYDEWDILNLDEEYGWSFEQIFHRLNKNGVECLSVDSWVDDEIVVLFGCYEDYSIIANVLGISEDCIYVVDRFGLVILNLYKEKCIRENNLN